MKKSIDFCKSEK